MYKRIIIVVICVVALFLTACGANLNEAPVETYTYVQDKVVDKFIVAYNSSSPFEMTNIKQGNIRTKYFAFTNDCYIEMINATNNAAGSFSITINGGQKEADKDRMFEVFAEIVASLDPNLSEENIKNVVDDIKTATHALNNYKINENLWVELYIPIIATTACRIELAAYNYG